MERRPGLILQHDEDGPPARLEQWLSQRGVAFVVHRTWEQPPPDPHRHAFMVSLGSGHSAVDPVPWIRQEIAALREAIAADIPVLGLCFGGQVLSVALGGGIDVLATPEIGWIPVHSVDASIPSGPWLQYHFDLLRVPPGARELARSPAGPAAFRYGRHLGLQFHPEADGPLVDLWARLDPKLPATGITAEQLSAQSAAHATGARAQAFRLFDEWLRTSVDGDGRRSTR
jgi:GMP synthase-like glutamine amidotransferase